MPTLSALVVARNEESRLDSCLSKLAFVNECVIVLDRSTDGSKKIAETHNAKIIEGAWPTEGPRRQIGEETCSGDWILEVDADEHVSAALAAEILTTIKKATPDQAFFRIPFDNYIGPRLVRYGWGAQFGVSAKIILYRNGMKKWGAHRVHPSVVMTGKNGGYLTNSMAHYVDESISDMIYRLDRYTTLNAQDLIDTNNLRTLRKNIARIFGRFWKCFVLRKGYKEGGLGLTIAILASLYPFLSYMKAQEILDAQTNKDAQ